METATRVPLQVLLIDDDEGDRFLTEDLVSRMRNPDTAQLSWASSYEAGLEALAKRNSDVCLLDYRLGARDGLELLGEARSRGSVCPIIVLTGQSQDGVDVLAMKRGADDYLIKGDLTVALLERSIHYAIARRRQQDALRASEARYRRLFEAAKDGILILAADTGVIVDVNPFMTDLTGYAREHFLGKHLWEIGPFRDEAASMASFAELKAMDYVRYDNLPLKTIDGRQIDVEFVSNVYAVDGEKVIQRGFRTARLRSGLRHARRARSGHNWHTCQRVNGSPP